MLASARLAVVMLLRRLLGGMGWRYVELNGCRARAWVKRGPARATASTRGCAHHLPSPRHGAYHALPNQLQAFIPRARAENPSPDLSRGFGRLYPFARFRFATPPELCVRRIRCRDPHRAEPAFHALQTATVEAASYADAADR